MFVSGEVNTVKRVKWKWFLPMIQLALALACHIYEPHEYRAKALQDRAVNNIEYTFQHSPALAGRISKGMNFPALVLAYPFRRATRVIYEHNSEYTLIWVDFKDLVFFFGTVLLWFLVGRRLDTSLGRSSTVVLPYGVRVTGLFCGAVFAIMTGAYAIQQMASKWRPENQIGAFGIVWSLSLMIYFFWQLTRELRARRRRY